jgi:hypothetical protein
MKVARLYKSVGPGASAVQIMAASAAADTYSWTNSRSGTGGIAHHNHNPMTGAFVDTLMRAGRASFQFDGMWDLFPLHEGVYFTAKIADEERGLLGLITEDEN